MSTNFGERIANIRTHYKLTQVKFGERIGVSRDVITNLENNRTTPDKLILGRLCEVYNINENWLQTGTGEMFRENKYYTEAMTIFKSLPTDLQEYALKQIQLLKELDEKHEK